ncbi:MAG: aryl-sulfate sulfotransferase [Armatimonadetes bacterium]|nr:aryl-sulfate sulfotransferase [Armatimonadota bacterium]
MRLPLRSLPAIGVRAALLCFLWPSSSNALFAWPSVYPTGTTVYDPGRSFNGYTLFAPLGDTPGEGPCAVYLVNMNGEVVHQWSLPFSPLHGRLQPNGNIIVIGRNDQQASGRPGFGKYEMGGAAGWLVELTWEGKRVFKHVDLNMHHDFTKLTNGDYLYLTWERVPPKLRKRVRGGIKGSEHADGTMFNDCLIEISPTGRKVWEWHANAHLDPALDLIGPLYKRQEWSHGNSVSVTSTGNILLTNRFTDSIMIVHRDSGWVVFRFGNTAYVDKASGALECRSGPQFFGGPHDAQEIPLGCPGAGHLLCYDNGIYTDESRAVEVDTHARRVVWQSTEGGVGRKHFSSVVGGVERLPNGNTLICDGANGRLFQVTRANEIVWEYVNPFMPSLSYRGAVFKAHTYAPDYCPQFRSLPPAKGEGKGTTMMPR